MARTKLPPPRNQFDLQHDAPIPEATRGRKLSLQHAARLYIYGGIDNLAEISRRTGCKSRHLADVRASDQWDDFAGRAWAAANDSIAPLAIRSVEEQQLIDCEKTRQHQEIQPLITEAKRCLESLPEMEVTSKPYAATLANIARLRALIEGSTHYDLAKGEAAAKIKVMVQGKAGSPGGSSQPGGRASGGNSEPVPDLNALGWGSSSQGDREQPGAAGQPGSQGSSQGRPGGSQGGREQPGIPDPTQNPSPSEETEREGGSSQDDPGNQGDQEDQGDGGRIGDLGQHSGGSIPQSTGIPGGSRAPGAVAPGAEEQGGGEQ